MKLAAKIHSIVILSAAFAGGPLLAGDAKTFQDKVVIEEPVKWYNAALSTGWDSLYMFRGVNVISHGAYGNNSNYGSGLSWTDLNGTWNITPHDTLNVGGWMAFGTQNTTYKELDLYTTYTHTIGDLALSAGYTFYYVFPTGSNFYANELNVKAAYALKFGCVTVTPSLAYFYNLGPSVKSSINGLVKDGSSYLLLRVDGSIPLFKDIISLTPWVAYGSNFQYNSKLNSDGSVDYFNGANNVEVGLCVPIKINNTISVCGYMAYSYAFYNLYGTTDPSTVWGGAKVTFSF